MNPKFTSLLYLQILLVLQILFLIALLTGYAWFQPRLSNVASNIQRDADKLPAIRQRIIEENDPETLRKDALVFLDGTADQSGYVQGMLMTPISCLKDFCFVWFIITTWLGVCVYQLQRQGRKDISSHRLDPSA
jgi:hypothetical protein